MIFLEFGIMDVPIDDFLKRLNAMKPEQFLCSTIGYIWTVQTFASLSLVPKRPKTLALLLFNKDLASPIAQRHFIWRIFIFYFPLFYTGAFNQTTSIVTPAWRSLGYSRSIRQCTTKSSALSACPLVRTPTAVSNPTVPWRTASLGHHQMFPFRSPPA